MKCFISKRKTISMIYEALNVYESETNISIFRKNSLSLSGDDPLVFGVNWSAHGTKDPEYTEKYARKLLEAARIADFLNRMEIVDCSEKEWIDVSEREICDCMVILKAADAEEFYNWILENSESDN